MPLDSITFKTEDLRRAPKLAAGAQILCPWCLGVHEVLESEPGPEYKARGERPALYIECGGYKWLVGVYGRLVLGLQPIEIEQRRGSKKRRRP